MAEYSRLVGGKDRPDRKRAMVDVESQACGTGLHELTNDTVGLTYCQFCRATWSELDAAINDREASWLD